jgi:hypothetical protein
MENDGRVKKLNYFDKLKVKKNLRRYENLINQPAPHYEKFN